MRIIIGVYNNWSYEYKDNLNDKEWYIHPLLQDRKMLLYESRSNASVLNRLRPERNASSLNGLTNKSHNILSLRQEAWNTLALLH
jgi:hypothetical protein